MKRSASFFHLLIAFAIVLFVGHGTAQAQSGDQVILRLKNKYDTIKTLRAEFTQTMSSSFSDGTESFSGKLMLEGDKYRVETGTQTLVTDGIVTWIYNASENQLLINDTVEDETTFSINEFFFNYPDRYEVLGVEVVQIDGQKHFRLNLKPKREDAFFQEVTLWMRDQDTVITRLEVTDLNETKMAFVLDNIELNPPLDRDTFRMDPPRGAEVIDLRS